MTSTEAKNIATDQEFHNSLSLTEKKEMDPCESTTASYAKEYSGIAKLPTELLQIVLANLDFRDLYSCQLVSRYWNDNILGGGARLKEALWLAYKPNPEDRKFEPKEDRVGIRVGCAFQGLRRKMRRGRAMIILSTHIDTREGWSLFLPDDAKRHPMLDQNIIRYLYLAYPSFQPRDHVSAPKSLFYGFNFYGFDDMDRIITDRTELKGSWVDMFCCIPPVTKIRMKVVFGTYFGTLGREQEKWVIEHKDGVRMKHIMEAFRSVLACCGEAARDFSARFHDES